MVPSGMDTGGGQGSIHHQLSQLHVGSGVYHIWSTGNLMYRFPFCLAILYLHSVSRVQFWQLMDSMVWIVILCLSLVIFPLHCSDVTATIGIRFFPHQAQSVLSLLLIRSVTWFVQCWCSSLHSITHCRSPLDSIAGHPNNGKCAPGATYTSWITSASQCLNFLTNKPYTGRRSESGPCSIVVAGCNESNYAVLVLRAPKNIPLMVLWLFKERHTLLRCPC